MACRSADAAFSSLSVGNLMQFRTIRMLCEEESAHMTSGPTWTTSEAGPNKCSRRSRSWSADSAETLRDHGTHLLTRAGHCRRDPDGLGVLGMHVCGVDVVLLSAVVDRARTAGPLARSCSASCTSWPSWPRFPLRCSVSVRDSCTTALRHGGGLACRHDGYHPQLTRPNPPSGQDRATHRQVPQV